MNRIRTKVDPCVAEQAEWGVISVAELLACGMTHRMIRVRVEAGRLHRIHRGVYAVGHPKLTREGEFLAAVKACGPRAVLSHFSAAVLWGLLVPFDRYPDVTTPSRRQRPRINTHKSGSLLTAAVSVHQGIRVTTPRRTLEDLARTRIPERALKRAVREATIKRLITPHDLGHHRLKSITPAPTRSVLEDLVLDLIVQGGFARPDVNVPIRVGTSTLIPDFRWPVQRLIVEADGAEVHAHTGYDDAARQALLEAHGERVLRVTYAQATRRRPEVIARLGNAGAPRG